VRGCFIRHVAGHDHLTSTTLPAGCTIKPPDAGSRQCPWVTALLKEQLSSSNPSGSWPKLTPTGQHAWRDTNRSSGACSNAYGRTGSNRSATRSPSLLIRRSVPHVRPVHRSAYPLVSVLPGIYNRRHSPVPSGQSVRKLCERSCRPQYCSDPRTSSPPPSTVMFLPRVIPWRPQPARVGPCRPAQGVPPA